MSFDPFIVVPHYQVIVKREGTLDGIEVKVEEGEELFRSVAQEILSDEASEHL
jgi:phenylacetate-CoA ligase